MDKQCECCGNAGFVEPAEAKAVWINEEGESDETIHYICHWCLEAGNETGPGYKLIERI